MKTDWSRERAFRVDADGCFLWRGPQHSGGHPTIYLGRGRAPLLRRKIMELSLGRRLRPNEKAVQTCGKPLCCSCVETVTARKVMKLAIARHDWTKEHGRRLKIAATRKRRWTDEQIADMRYRHSQGERSGIIAASYGTRSGNLTAILQYRTHVLRLPDAVRFALAAR